MQNADGSCDVAVLGVGGLGAALFDALATRGVDVLGVEQHGVAHDRGSSFGGTRVIRTAYFEDARYVPLLQRAWALWRELAEDARAPLLAQTGVVNIGPRDHPAMRALTDAVRMHALPHEVLDADALRARTPLEPADGDVGVYEQQGGFLRVEACIEALVARARTRGARLLHDAVTQVDPEGVGVRLMLASGAVVRARRVVVCAGAWAATREATRALFDDIPLEVTRQAQLWWTSRTSLDGMPAFIHFTPHGVFYGIPPADGRGVKVCQHDTGPGRTRVTPDTLDRDVHDQDLAPVRAYLARSFPRADGGLADAKVCMYTRTPDEHFAIGPHPQHPHVWRASACSGHGYKLTIVLAEALAELLAHGRTAHDLSLFDPARFR